MKAIVIGREERNIIWAVSQDDVGFIGFTAMCQGNAERFLAAAHDTRVLNRDP